MTKEVESLYPGWQYETTYNVEESVYVAQAVGTLPDSPTGSLDVYCYTGADQEEAESNLMAGMLRAAKNRAGL